MKLDSHSVFVLTIANEIKRVMITVRQKCLKMLFSKSTLNEFLQDVVEKTKIETEFKIQYYDQSFNSFIDLEDINDIKDLTKIKVVCLNDLTDNLEAKLGCSNDNIDNKGFIKGVDSNESMIDTLADYDNDSSKNRDVMGLGEPSSSSNSTYTSPHQKLSSTWHLTYDLPRFPERITDLLEKGDIAHLTCSHRDQIVTILYDDIYPLCNFYPKSVQYEHVIRLLLQKFPSLSKSSTMDVTMGVWIKKLQNKFKNRRPIDGLENQFVVARKINRRHFKEKWNENEPDLKKKTRLEFVRADDAWGVKNYLPNIDCGDDEFSMNDIRDLLRKLYNEKTPDMKRVSTYMDKTFPLRRKLVVTLQKSVMEVASEFPWLRHLEEMEQEFYRILGDDTQSSASLMNGLAFEYDALKFIYLSAKRKPTQKMNIMIEKLGSMRLEEEKKELQAEIAFHLLAALLREDANNFLSEKQEENHPSVFIYKEEDWFTLYLEGLKIRDITCFTKALHLFVASFYIYNLAYSTRCHKTLLFLQRRYFQLHDAVKLQKLSISLIAKLDEYKEFKS